jgi:hypothetical protein
MPAVAKPPKIKTVIYLPPDLNHKLWQARADTRLAVTNQIERILRAHFNRTVAADPDVSRADPSQS